MAATYTESKQLKATGPRAWWRAHFYDHPGYSETPRDPQSKTTGEHGKTKIWCKLCLQKRVGDEMQLDEQNGRHREAHEIEVFLWSLPSGQDERGYRWIASTSAAALLPKYTTRTTFPLVPIDVPNAAQRLTSQRQTLNTPAAWSQWPTQESLSKRPLRLLVAQVDHWPLPFLRSSFPMLLVRLPDPHFPLLLPLEDRHTRSRTSGLPTQALHLAHLRAYLVAMDQASGAFVIHLPHLVCMSDPLLLPLNVNHVVWVQEHFRVKPVSPSAWNPRQFLRSPLNANRCLSPSLRASLRRCVSLDLENPIWIEFVEEFISGHSAPNPTPSRKVLTTRIIPGTVKQYRSIAQLACKGKLVTIQCDGFTAANRRHLVSFMVTCERKVYTVRTFDTSTEPKTAENLVKMIYQVMRMLEDEWEVIPIAITTDCSGESRAARARILGERSSLVTPDCYAHQVERVVIDYFGVKTDIFIWTKQADELIRWLRSRTYVLGLLNEIQLGLPGASNHPPKTVILGALTRWTTMYLAYKRLLELKLPLEHLAAHPLLAASGNAESRQKTKDMLDRLKNPLFWYNLARVKLHLEPLAIAANITQSQDCRLDDVLLTFGFLYQSFNALVEERDNAVRTAVLGSLEKRWAKADQDVFIAAVILNPYLRLSPFRASLTQYFVPATVYGLILRLWDRFYPDSTEKPTLSDVRDYLKFTPGSRYGSMPSILQHEKDEALRKVFDSLLDPVEIWKNFMPDVDPSEPQPTIPIDPPPLPALAIRILSVCPSSAERTRLTTTNLLNIAELRLHLRDEQVRKDAKKRLKRHFGERVAQARAQSSNAPLEAPADDDESNGSALDDEQSQPGEPSRIRQAIREAQQGLQELIEYMRERDIEDSILTSDSFISTIRVPLATLFDFSNAYWQTRADLSPSNTLDEELAIWDLLDMDADGEDDSAEGRGSDEMADELFSMS
ncbi:hypothetical protein BN946_scf184983.g7 [Trametes cinnabarina]|uniref:DUF659 domain-containing protein n=1 Tax=Pycnoporus cinnabarinus TaxID=5643 RepID=A0A060SJW9_PYCCI|nr:hypothetical protein BN946_scf184983.g7 [Trametes cinnabarina]